MPTSIIPQKCCVCESNSSTEESDHINYEPAENYNIDKNKYQTSYNNEHCYCNSQHKTRSVTPNNGRYNIPDDIPVKLPKNKIDASCECALFICDHCKQAMLEQEQVKSMGTINQRTKCKCTQCSIDENDGTSNYICTICKENRTPSNQNTCSCLFCICTCSKYKQDSIPQTCCCKNCICTCTRTNVSNQQPNGSPRIEVNNPLQCKSSNCLNKKNNNLSPDESDDEQVKNSDHTINTQCGVPNCNFIKKDNKKESRVSKVFKEDTCLRSNCLRTCNGSKSDSFENPKKIEYPNRRDSDIKLKEYNKRTNENQPKNPQKSNKTKCGLTNCSDRRDRYIKSKIFQGNAYLAVNCPNRSKQPMNESKRGTSAVPCRSNRAPSKISQGRTSAQPEILGEPKQERYSTFNKTNQENIPSLAQQRISQIPKEDLDQRPNRYSKGRGQISDDNIEEPEDNRDFRDQPRVSKVPRDDRISKIQKDIPPFKENYDNFEKPDFQDQPRVSKVPRDDRISKIQKYIPPVEENYDDFEEPDEDILHEIEVATCFLSNCPYRNGTSKEPTLEENDDTELFSEAIPENRENCTVRPSQIQSKCYQAYQPSTLSVTSRSGKPASKPQFIIPETPNEDRYSTVRGVSRAQSVVPEILNDDRYTRDQSIAPNKERVSKIDRSGRTQTVEERYSAIDQPNQAQSVTPETLDEEIDSTSNRSSRLYSTAQSVTPERVSKIDRTSRIQSTLLETPIEERYSTINRANQGKSIAPETFNEERYSTINRPSRAYSKAQSITPERVSKIDRTSRIQSTLLETPIEERYSTISRTNQGKSVAPESFNEERYSTINRPSRAPTKAQYITPERGNKERFSKIDQSDRTETTTLETPIEERYSTINRPTRAQTITPEAFNEERYSTVDRFSKISARPQSIYPEVLSKDRKTSRPSTANRTSRAHSIAPETPNEARYSTVNRSSRAPSMSPQGNKERYSKINQPANITPEADNEEQSSRSRSKSIFSQTPTEEISLDWTSRIASDRKRKTVEEEINQERYSTAQRTSREPTQAELKKFDQSSGVDNRTETLTPDRYSTVNDPKKIVCCPNCPYLKDELIEEEISQITYSTPNNLEQDTKQAKGRIYRAPAKDKYSTVNNYIGGGNQNQSRISESSKGGGQTNGRKSSRTGNRHQTMTTEQSAVMYTNETAESQLVISENEKGLTCSSSTCPNRGSETFDTADREQSRISQSSRKGKMSTVANIDQYEISPTSEVSKQDRLSTFKRPNKGNNRNQPRISQNPDTFPNIPNEIRETEGKKKKKKSR